MPEITIRDSNAARKSVAADLIAGAYFQRVKMTWGIEGVAVDVSADAPLPTGDAAALAQLQAVAEQLGAMQTALASILAAQVATGPITGGADVVPDDAGSLPAATRLLYVGTFGDVRVGLADGSIVTFTAVAPGLLPARATRVYATGTTAGAIRAAW
jgi:hypothetical protein